MNREFVRMSLGGLHDESEIRGHRKTYIGAMPGRILQSIKKAGTSNPVFILDEIDKVGNDFRGDPQSALLEVLDPEQNGSFHDNFLDIDYDLSKVMFIATANDLSTIAGPLRDRMEIIEVTGYLMEEKREIAKRHLIPKQLENHGITAGHVTIPDEIIDLIIEKLGCKSRAIELSTLQRCAGHLTSRVDITEAYQVGGTAVKAAFEGKTGQMVILKRVSQDPYICTTDLYDVHKVANLEKKVPRSWITEEGDYVTAEMKNYIEPLIQAELTPIMITGQPRHIIIDDLPDIK